MAPFTPLVPLRRSSNSKPFTDDKDRRISLMPQPLMIAKRARRPFTKITSRHYRLPSSSSLEEFLLSPPTPPKHGSPPSSPQLLTPAPAPLTHPLLNKSLPALPTTSVSYPTPPASPTTETPPSSISSYNTTPQSPIASPAIDPLSRCHACSKALESKTETLSFPLTAPAVRSSVYHIFNKARGIYSLSYLPEKNMLFCCSCFTKLRDLHMCWGCGLPVVRPEERVKCGWAWWHWGCVSCLLCRVPIIPPTWTGSQIELFKSPVCTRCDHQVGEMVERESLYHHHNPHPLPSIYREEVRGVREKHIEALAASGEIARSTSGYDGSCELEDEGIMGEYRREMERLRLNQWSAGKEGFESWRGGEVREGSAEVADRIVAVAIGKRVGSASSKKSMGKAREGGTGRRVSSGRIGKGKGEGTVRVKNMNIGWGKGFPVMPRWMEKLPGNVRRAAEGC